MDWREVGRIAAGVAMLLVLWAIFAVALGGWQEFVTLEGN